MARLTFYGGVGQIGGNKILLEDGDSALFFDFGISFADRGRYYEEFVNPRPGAGLLDPIEMGLIPPLHGLYRKDLEGPDLWERVRGARGYRLLPSVNGLLLSHAHVDHSGHVSFLRPDIPVYATQLTAFIAKAMQDSSPTDFEKEVCYLSPRELGSNGYLATAREKGFQQRPFVFLDGFLSTDEAQSFWDRSPARTKPMEVAPTAALPTKIGKLSLRFYPTDHSIFGATAYAVETSSGWVVYTGDLRLHGGHAETTRRFIAEAAALRPAALLCEGTRIDSAERVTEEEVYANILGAVQGEPGLVVADFGPRNIERLKIFLKVARHTGRTLVILAKDAYLLDAMRLASEEVPDLVASNDILIFDDLRARDEGWRQHVRSRHGTKFVKPEVIHRDQGGHILCFSFWDINDLVDVRPQGGLYIYSSSEAFDEEQRMDLRRLRAWIDHFGMQARGLPQAYQRPDGSEEWVLSPEERGFHASGHASGPELIDMIKEIEPKTLIPIHTEKPEFFAEALAGTSTQVAIPERNGSILLP